LICQYEHHKGHKTALARRYLWEALPAVTWTFEPNGLCPLPRVRFERGASYIELGFNALTGDVEDESSYLP